MANDITASAPLVAFQQKLASKIKQSLFDMIPDEIVNDLTKSAIETTIFGSPELRFRTHRRWMDVGDPRMPEGCTSAGYYDERVPDEAYVLEKDPNTLAYMIRTELLSQVTAIIKQEIAEWYSTDIDGGNKVRIITGMPGGYSQYISEFVAKMVKENGAEIFNAGMLSVFGPVFETFINNIRR